MTTILLSPVLPLNLRTDPNLAVPRIQRPTMLTIWDLPQPIRFRIYQHVLTSSLDPPSSLLELHTADSDNKVQRIHRHGADVAEFAVEKCIRYPITIHLPFAGLLRSSSRVRREVKEIARMLQTKRVAYRLDLVIENELTMLPSWLRCPVTSMDVSRLDIDVRLLGFVDEAGPDFPLDGSQQHGRDRCRTLAFAILALIARFIDRGPRFEHVRHGEIKVQSLTLNFHSRLEEAKPHRLRLGRSNSVEEERGLMDHLCMTQLHEHHRHDSAVEADRPRPSRSDPSEVVEARDLLRTVDLVLRPLCRQEQYTLERRLKHFSTSHLGFLRRNVRRICLSLDGIPERAMTVES
ncbi:uncharacterized protein PV09_08937 [Verruconis gallopava]|uniref:Uncharacterized protein n=1 Tax=Verruconis gallopava TaxID=253628 RepID=A0A0D1ZZA0_9PEZI|nr:uncharacterized protein PV09_08937 [Verruconis gallopava]KIV99394.1 hypothetical protein PV09_08937 [Verruconis gallopava]